MDNQLILKSENTLVRVMPLEKNASTEWHYHTEVTDHFVCLNGLIKVEAKNPDKEVMLQPGQITEIKPLHVHRVENVNDHGSAYLLIQGVGTYDFIKV